MKVFALMAYVLLALVVVGCEVATLVDAGSSTASEAVAGKV